MNKPPLLPLDQPGGYDRRDFDDPPEIPPEFRCRCCGEFNELHDKQDICGDCQDEIERNRELKKSELREKR